MNYIQAFNPRKPRILSEDPYILPQARIKDSHFGKDTEIADGTRVMHSTIDFSYAMEYCYIILGFGSELVKNVSTFN
jgi:hypothetical protein